MINEEGHHVLKNVLVKQLNGIKLAERLAEPKIKSKIQDALSRKIIWTEEYDALYPTLGDIQLDNIDVTLLVFLIRQLHPFMKVSNKIWTEPPPGNNGPEANVARLRIKRNKLIHTRKTILTEDEFECEFQEIEQILCRLEMYSNNAGLTDLSEKLTNKKTGVFEIKPETSDRATSTSSSLDEAEEHTNVSGDVIESTHSVPSIADTEFRIFSYGVSDNSTQNATTSTSSLEKKRKFSFKMKSYLEPFIMSTKKPYDVTNSIELPQRRRVKDMAKSSSSGKRCTAYSCNVKGTCRNVEATSCMTNDHASQSYRCNISGLTVLPSGVIIAVDSSHNVVQALSATGELMDEFECSQPHGVAKLSTNTFAVSLRKSCQIVVLKMSIDNKSIELVNEFQIRCDVWLSDLKYNRGYLYVLCDHGDLHMCDAQKGSEMGLFPTKMPLSSNFDISPKGDRLFLSNGHRLTCLDFFGNTIWTYADKLKQILKGVVLHKNKMYVCAWNCDKVIELTKKGKLVRAHGEEQMQNPWSLSVHKGRLYLSQYMSELDSGSCREIVMLKV